MTNLFITVLKKLSINDKGYSFFKYIRFNKLVLHEIFRWGTHLYMSLIPSVCPSVRPSRTITQQLLHHVITIFGTHDKK